MNFDHLRKLLIQKALEGKLVPQLDSEQKVAQGELTENALQEIPFNIPEKWKWFKLNKFVSVISGTSFKKTDQVSEGNGVRVIRGGNLRDFKIETKKDDVFVDNSLHDSDKEIQSSDIVIVASTGSKEVIGRAACYRGNEKIQIGAFLRIIRPNKKEYAPYLKILFQSDYYRKHIRNCSKGTNINNIKKEYITELFIPIPPVQEQRRIVAKLEEAFAEIDRAEKAYEELQTLAGVLRGQILQEAIQGKLVPQLAEEGVVEQIGAAPEEVPFEIPESWRWVKLKSVFSMQAGKFISASSIQPEGRFPCYGGNGLRGYVDISNRKGRFPLIGRQGALCGNVHVVDGEFYATEHAVVVDCGEYGDPDCVGLFLEAMNLNQYATATAQPGLSVKKIIELPFPLPPKDEQVRIVSKVKDLMKQVDALSAR